MGISQSFLNFSKLSYIFAAAVSVGLPLIEVLDKTFKLHLGFVTSLVEALPMYKEGLSWLLPTLVVVLTSLAVKALGNLSSLEKARQEY